MHERQALGERLAGLGAAQLARLPLPEALRSAIEAVQRMRGHEARRRQMQYIGRLMREADFEAIGAAYADVTGDSRRAVALMHGAERLRERLLDDDAALSEFVRARPGVDAQWLRTKVRAARAERASSRAGRHGRELYRWLHERLGADAPEAGAADPE